MLEAKTKDQGVKDTGTSILKKKGLQIFVSGETGLKIFFQGISDRGKQKKVFANFPQGLWRFPRKFQRFKK